MMSGKGNSEWTPEQRRAAELLTDEPLERKVKRAQDGDTLAAKEVLELLTDMIRDGQPVPKSARSYLADALDPRLKIAGAVEVRLGLKRRGKKNSWAYFEKRLAVDIVKQLYKQPPQMSIDEACEEASEMIREILDKSPPAWAGFNSRVPTGPQLKVWFYEEGQPVK